MNKFPTPIAMSLIALLSTAVLHAQVDQPTGQKPGAAPAAKESTSRSQRGSAERDAVLSAWLLVGNNNEISLSRIALEKAQSEEVKQFAKQMIDEHGKFAQKLEPFAKSIAKSDHQKGDRDARDAGADDRDDGADRRRPADADVARRSSSMETFDHASLIRDLGKKCLATETKMLNEKTGAEFDHLYAQMQVAAHVKCADMLEVFGTYASEGLRPTLSEGHKTVLAHLEVAKNLCKQAEKAVNTAKAEKIGSQNGK